MNKPLAVLRSHSSLSGLFRLYSLASPSFTTSCCAHEHQPQHRPIKNVTNFFLCMSFPALIIQLLHFKKEGIDMPSVLKIYLLYEKINKWLVIYPTTFLSLSYRLPGG